jgi:hypothetical protein
MQHPLRPHSTPSSGEGLTSTVVLIIAAAAAMGEFSGVQAQFTTNLTADELAYATAVGVVAQVLDTTTLASLGPPVGGKWIGIAMADNVGKLFAAPHSGAVHRPRH